MVKGNSNKACSFDNVQYNSNPKTGCRVESILTIDDRGQMVLPKDVCERADIKSGDKFTLISWEKDGGICCLALIKVENLSGMIKDLIGPLMYNSEL